MITNSKQICISNELIIQKHGNGIELVRPTFKLARDAKRVADLINLPFIVWFVDLNYRNLKINHSYINECGFDSAFEALQKSAWEMTTEECAKEIFEINSGISSAKKGKFFEINLNFINNIYLPVLSTKLPLYANNNQLIGLLGFSAVIGKHSLAEFINTIVNLGMLNNHRTIDEKNYLPGRVIAGQYLTKRQTEVLQWLIRGKTIREISAILNLSHRTVGHYFEAIKMKLDVSSKSELIDKVFDSMV